MSQGRVVVVGGGLAGMAAALSLHEAGREVVLIERRHSLGGRAGSFHSPALGGRLIDNSQHVLLGCCHSLLRFYRHLGVEDHIHFSDEILFVDERGTQAVMQASPLPSPLHLLPSLLGYQLVGWRQRAEIAAAMVKLGAISAGERPLYASRSFLSLLHEWGQSSQSISRFWDVICVSALNEPCGSAAAHFGLQVFQEAFLGGRRAYRVGVARLPLSRLYERLPFAVCRGDAVQGITRRRAGGFTVASSRQQFQADAVVLAVHPRAAVGLLEPPLASSPDLQRLQELQYGAILGVHLLYDRPVLAGEHVALVGTRLQWLFRDAADPCLLHGVVSAPGGLVAESQESLVQLFDGEVRLVCPGARGAALCSAVVIKEKQATFRAVPGVERLRPGARTAAAGLYLAGDYVQTGWPSTMEGAVIGGNMAAAAVLADGY
jgi:squalene-associated FAD-dependent desaturase